MPPRKRRQYRHLPAFILLALAEGPIHGGAIRNVIAKQLSEVTVDSAAVYRALQLLENDGEVVSTWDTTKAGPALRIYRLTPAGWDKLRQWKTDIEHRIAVLNNFLTTCDRLHPAP